MIVHFALLHCFKHRAENVFQGVLHICNAFRMILFDDLFCEVLARCAFLFLCHFVHSFSVLSFIVAHFSEIEKVCKLFFNLHTLFYKLIWTKQSVKIYSRIVCASDCVCANKAAKAQSEELVYLRTGRASGCS